MTLHKPLHHINQRSPNRQSLVKGLSDGSATHNQRKTPTTPYTNIEQRKHPPALPLNLQSPKKPPIIRSVSILSPSSPPISSNSIYTRIPKPVPINTVFSQYIRFSIYHHSQPSPPIPCPKSHLIWATQIAKPQHQRGRGRRRERGGDLGRGSPAMDYSTRTPRGLSRYLFALVRSPLSVDRDPSL